jgi:thiamine-monophosphate kinase
VDEFALIERFFARGGDSGGVITGIGDDGAVLRPDPDKDLVNVIDTMVGGVHFPNDIEPADLGYRIVAVNLSDIAAMGASPRWMTLAITLPSAEEQWLAEFASGLFDAAAEHDVSLVGGDTTSGEQLVVSVQINGDIAQGQSILRSGARAGDTIYVTGTVGDAAAGLALMQAGRPESYLAKRFLRPTARVECGQALVGIATAAIDVSDGLYGDLRKLLDASGVGAEIDLEKLPLSTQLIDAFDAEDRRRFALSGGDDYELCFTSAAELEGDVAGVPITAIGKVIEGGDLQCRDANGIVEFEDSGYLHFQ